ncbi:glycine/sarcosine/betaine reductase selenoprotein B family protein [Bacillus salitolerans]|uniref:Glycine/sarcosine/betaine reductase selenoprotein B family protein n=1 Tax=Bacillus salitolerans TaxID=1437434 RepID=A0ABW4LNS8_9BACI
MTETSKSTQLRPGLWNTVNERYPGSMISKEDFIPLSFLNKPLSKSKLTFISSAGVQPMGTMPFDTVHPIGDYTYRKVPSHLKPEELEIHQLKYPTVGANQDINVIFPIERLQELSQDGVIGGLTSNFFSFIGYNMDPDKLELKLAEDIADAVVKDHADIALLCPA